MVRDFSFENKITDGYVQIMKQFIVGFDKATIIFENAANQKQKSLQFSRIISLSMIVDSPDDLYDTDVIAYRSLIGFDFERNDSGYVYVIKVDGYEITIESLNFVTLDDIN